MQHSHLKEKEPGMRGEAAILAKTYKDRLTVVRGVPAVDDSGESVRKDAAVYENVPCARSKGTVESPKSEDNRRVSDAEHVIFAAPDILMADMDRAVIVTEAGQVFRGVCGRTFSYAGSHGETPFRIEEMA